MSEIVADTLVNRLLLIMAGLVAVALSAAIYMYYTKPPLTLSLEELHPRTVSPYYSGLPIGSVYPATKNAPVQVKSDAAYDVKRCAPKALESVEKLGPGPSFFVGDAGPVC